MAQKEYKSNERREKKVRNSSKKEEGCSQRVTKEKNKWGTKREKKREKGNIIRSGSN